MDYTNTNSFPSLQLSICPIGLALAVSVEEILRSSKICFLDVKYIQPFQYKTTYPQVCDLTLLVGLLEIEEKSSMSVTIENELHIPHSHSLVALLCLTFY